MFSTSFRKRTLSPIIRQLTPVPLPERVPQPSLARPYLHMTAVGKIREHPGRLVDGERSLQRRQRRRDLPMPRESLQKLPLLALLRYSPTFPRTGLREPRQSPRHRHERRGHEEQKQPSYHQPHHEPRRKGPPVRCHRPPPTRVAHHAPTVHLASFIPTARCSFAVYHDIS